MVKKILGKCQYLLLLGLFTSSVALANTVDAGEVAENLMGPVVFLANFIGGMSVIIGASFLFASLLKYMQHRVNPIYSPISTVIALLIMGIVLVLLPLAYKLTSSGVPLSI